MNRNVLSIPNEEDCFTKMHEYFRSQEKPKMSKIGILHSRFASDKNTI